ncbi:hypothetical protein [Nocardioides aurantiacus]|uniref:Uncharacterized protein n=1 Tax=Nocardioides aurantiacus TaxID=86796 RepID=A0A3N2CWJ7_9ACTN|nr:hypothetical protein [Nocardioides aurantiacus]ROR91564.1 hypothetical protein EDD33_2434 [Nocardioides aurantiacus]
MSKMDNLRAMREARYEQNAARAGTRPAARRATPPVAPPEAAAPRASRAAKAASAAQPPAEGAAEELCGHRNMSGRTCTREAGHAAKSHRYS